MKPIGTHNYFVYIITNKNKTTFYTGVTNDLATRLYQHKTESCTTKKTFAGKYNCVYLVFYEHFDYIEDAIDREKEIIPISYQNEPYKTKYFSAYRFKIFVA